MNKKNAVNALFLAARAMLVELIGIQEQHGLVDQALIALGQEAMQDFESATDDQEQEAPQPRSL